MQPRIVKGVVSGYGTDGMPKIALLTAGKDPHYALGLVKALAETGTRIELIGDDEMAKSELARHRNITVLPLLGDPRDQRSFAQRAKKLVRYYLSLLVWAARTDADLFHILWYRKFALFERHVLNTSFRLLGKKLVYTAHNVDDRQRDGEESWVNRTSLRVMYRALDHVLVHTRKMERELGTRFGVRSDRMTVVPHGINETIPETKMTCPEARRRLDFEPREKVLLFFGNIAPYKGLELLASAFLACAQTMDEIRLVVAGDLKKRKYGAYWSSIEERLAGFVASGKVRMQFGLVPDEEVELFFKAADVSVLPYREICQSGVMILSYRFGLPVIATDVGSLREDIIEGETGFVCKRNDAQDLSSTIEKYFGSELYKDLARRRQDIRSFARERFSWESNVNGTLPIYRRLSRSTHRPMDTSIA